VRLLVGVSVPGKETMASLFCGVLELRVLVGGKLALSTSVLGRRTLSETSRLELLSYLTNTYRQV
jgi:hypothetical protein